MVTTVERKGRVRYVVAGVSARSPSTVCALAINYLHSSVVGKSR
jgi:hypothetical protein